MPSAGARVSIGEDRARREPVGTSHSCDAQRRCYYPATRGVYNAAARSDARVRLARSLARLGRQSPKPTTSLSVHKFPKRKNVFEAHQALQTTTISARPRSRRYPKIADAVPFDVIFISLHSEVDEMFHFADACHKGQLARLAFFPTTVTRAAWLARRW